MPLLAIGTLMTTGLFSIPFFVIGIAALNADKLGLTGTKGYLNTALQKAKSLGLAAHKKTIKMSIANSFTDYREKLRFQINSVFEKTVEHQLQQIGYAQSIKNDLEKVLSDSGIEKTRILIKEVEATLSK